ncbi:transposable element Tcb1 transposase [Trichonephila clavipes]|nr:transposable element Tcb1 transposase [Trichonephila clavipes]
MEDTFERLQKGIASKFERITSNYCQTLLWSVRSPDLSPIEHVWDMMGTLRHLPDNVNDLTRQLEQIWQEIRQEITRKLHHLMSRRVAACIQLRINTSLSSLLCN